MTLFVCHPVSPCDPTEGTVCVSLPLLVLLSIYLLLLVWPFFFTVKSNGDIVFNPKKNHVFYVISIITIKLLPMMVWGYLASFVVYFSVTLPVSWKVCTSHIMVVYHLRLILVQHRVTVVTCSKSTIESSEKVWNMFKGNNKNWPFSGCFIVNFDYISHFFLHFLSLLWTSKY